MPSPAGLQGKGESATLSLCEAAAGEGFNHSNVKSGNKNVRSWHYYAHKYMAFFKWDLMLWAYMAGHVFPVHIDL